MLDSEGKAKEMISVLRDDPDSFAEMAREHSIADTREHGGLIGKVLRGSLRGDVEAKVFNAGRRASCSDRFASATARRSRSSR